jgi:hypothetical protein
MCSDDEEGADGADARILQPRTPRNPRGMFAAAPPSTRSAGAAAAAPAAKRPRGPKAAAPPAAKRSRVEPPPAATAASTSSRSVRSLADLVDAGTQRGNRYTPLHRTEQIAIVLKLCATIQHLTWTAGKAPTLTALLKAPRSSPLGDWPGDERRWTREARAHLILSLVSAFERCASSASPRSSRALPPCRRACVRTTTHLRCSP